MWQAEQSPFEGDTDYQEFKYLNNEGLIWPLGARRAWLFEEGHGFGRWVSCSNFILRRPCIVGIEQTLLKDENHVMLRLQGGI